jgi:hypothetical protein
MVVLVRRHRIERADALGRPPVERLAAAQPLLLER